MAIARSRRNSKSNRSVNPPRRSYRTSLQALEERWALAALSVINIANDGPGSLRQAILDSNASVGVYDTISFDIGGGGVQSIAPTSGLPAITDPVTIDGTTQPGFAGSPLIELNGASAGPASGLVITAGNSTVRGLVINQFQIDGGFQLDGKGNGIVLSTNGGNVIEGNYIGLNVSGTAALGNRRMGILIFAGSSANRIGTNGDGIVDAAERNLISGNGTVGNTSSGIGVDIFGAGTNDNVVAGNFFGTDVTGTLALGNVAHGVMIQSGAQGNRIGTDGSNDDNPATPLVREDFNANERNVISGNASVGVAIAAAGTDNNTVAGNYIGTDATGTAALGNGRFGVNFFLGAQGNQVGGAAAALGNTIAFNGLAGVNVLHNAATGTTVATGNRIQGNSIHSNGGLGIELNLTAGSPDGVTPNDPSDADTGPNNLQNFPELTVALAGATTHVEGTLNSVAGKAYTLDFYASAVADPTGFGEGQRYLGSLNVTLPAGVNTVSFSGDIADAWVGEVLTATATDPDGNTSEFSGALTFGLPLGPVTFEVTNTSDSGPFSLRQAIQNANAHPGLDTIAFAIPGSGVHTITPGAAQGVPTGLGGLPTITDPLTIDGTTQPSFAGTPVIELSGASAGPRTGCTSLPASARCADWWSTASAATASLWRSTAATSCRATSSAPIRPARSAGGMRGRACSSKARPTTRSAARRPARATSSLPTASGASCSTTVPPPATRSRATGSAPTSPAWCPWATAAAWPSPAGTTSSAARPPRPATSSRAT